MTRSLAERQARLIRYLADPAAFAGADDPRAPPGDGAIDRVRLGLVGTMGLEKRTARLRALLPRSCAQLGPGFPAILRDFAHHHPPASMADIDHARQLRDYLASRPALARGAPPFLGDLLRVEIAIAEVRQPETGAACLGRTIDASDTPAGRCRVVSRYEAVVCTHDVRRLFDAAAGDVPAGRDLRLVVAMRGAQTRPRIFEVPVAVHDFLVALRAAGADATLAAPNATLRMLRDIDIVDAVP